MGCQLSHSSAATRRTKAASLAGKRHEKLVMAIGAAEARKAAGQDAAGQELPHFVLDKLWQAFTIAAQARLGEKGLEVLAHHLVQDGVLRAVADVSTTGAAEPVRTSPHLGEY